MSLLLALLLIIIIFIDRMMAKLSGDDIPWYLSPAVWLVSPWIFCALVFSAPLIVHREQLSLYHIFYITGSIAAFVIGSNVRGFGRPRRTLVDGPAMQNLQPTTKLLSRLFVLGLIGSVFIIYDNLLATGISLKDRLLGTGLSAARDFAFASQAQGVRGPYFLLEPLAGFGLIFLLVYLHARFSNSLPIEDKRKYFWYAVITVGMAAFNSLVIFGGRMGIVLLLIVLMQAFLFDKHRTIFIWLKSKAEFSRFFWLVSGFAVMLMVVVLLGTVYVQKRSNDQSPIAALYLGHRAELAPWLLAATSNHEQMRYGLFTLSYITTPLATLSMYLDLTENRMPGPFYGQYNFPGIADRIVKRIDKNSFMMWWDARMEVFGPLLRLGYGGNVWATLLRDLAADVGRPAVPFLMFLFGWLCRAAIVRAYRFSNPYWGAIGCALLCVALFSAFHSLIYITTVSSLIFIGSALLILRWFNGLWTNKYQVTTKYLKGQIRVNRV